MQKICSEEIKQRAAELGADLCGIAAVERFSDAPQGFHPQNIMPDCKSVIVLALRFPLSTLAALSQAPYTFARNRLMDKVDGITFQLASEWEDRGYCAVPIPSSEPYEFWDAERRHGQGILSLKHAAVRAGLGQMGKNTLFVNKDFGNMVWLGAVLLDQELTPDAVADYQVCKPECRICLEACPAQALNGTTIVQRKCREVSGKYTEGGEGLYACNLCRKVCPNYKGIN